MQMSEHEIETEKWERILAECDASDQRCQQRQEALQVIDSTVSYLELGVARQEARIGLLIDESLDTLSRVLQVSNFSLQAVGVKFDI